MRSTLRSPFASGAKKKVSCISRAGWPTGKFSAVKLCSSSSTSGPSATEKPRSAKIATISSVTWLTGWMRPMSIPLGRTGSVTSTASEARRASSAAEARASCDHERRLDTVAQAVDGRAERLAFVGRHLAELPELFGDRALLAKGGNADGSRAPPRRKPIRSRRESGIRARSGRSYGRIFRSVALRLDRRAHREIDIDVPVKPEHDGYAGWNLRPGGRENFQPSAVLACETSAWKAAGSRTARSERTLRSISTPAFDRPSIKRE